TVVLHDEIDLPFGEVRSKLGGGVAGHNGLRSVAKGFGGRDFWRVRAGVGRPDSTDPEIVAAYVLSRFPEPESEVRALVERDADGRVHRMELFARLYDELTGFPKPTVAACHGSCVGGGAEVAVACDLRVAGANLRMRFPGAALGVPVGPARLVTLCGLSVAKYALLTSKEIDAEMAYRWGLIHKLVPAPRTEGAALKLAVDVAAHPPESVARIKRMLHE